MQPLPGSELRYNSAGARARLTLRFIELISRVIIHPPISASPCRCYLYFLVLAFSSVFTPCFAQQVHLPAASGGVADISSSGPQQKKGDLFIADSDVDITYSDMRLRTDHVEYNNDTSEASARGHVLFDFENQHLEADDGILNIASGRGTFHNVRGTIKLDRRPNPTLLITQNPLYFEAREVQRLSADVYVIHHAWFTVCEPAHPTWQFYAPEAKVTLQKSVALVNANFRLFRVPLLWLPYSTAPAGDHIRQSGFLLPVVGKSNTKGYVLGDAFYWAPKSWMDAGFGLEYFSRRGWAQRGDFRARPF